MAKQKTKTLKLTQNQAGLALVGIDMIQDMLDNTQGTLRNLFSDRFNELEGELDVVAEILSEVRLDIESKGKK